MARVSAHGTPEEKAKVKAAVYRKYPQLKKNTSEEEGGDKMEEKLKTLEEQNALLLKELEELKLSKKSELVEELCEMNSKLVKEDLIKESDEMLKLRKDYESKLVKEQDKKVPEEKEADKKAPEEGEDKKDKKPEDKKDKKPEEKEDEEDKEPSKAVAAEGVKEDFNEDIGEGLSVNEYGAVSFSDGYYKEFNKSIKDLLG